MNIKIYITLISICLLPFSKVVAQISVQNPKCEMLTNPLGIDVTQPRLSWEIVSDKRNLTFQGNKFNREER